MIAALLCRQPVWTGDPDVRALAWLARSGWTRAAQATLIGVLVWLATGQQTALFWLTLTIGGVALNTRVSQWALGRLTDAKARAVATAAHLLGATAFCCLVLPLVRSPSPGHLAGAVLMLCAVCLNNAMMARGSRTAMWALIAPSSLTLMASPLLAPLFGYPIAFADMAALSTASGFFVVFILRLAATFEAEGQSLKQTLEALSRQTAAAQTAERAAEESKHRWRMIFDQAPVAQGVLNASRLYEFLTSRAKPGQSLGEVLLGNFTEPAEILDHVDVLGCNDVLQAVRGERPGDARFLRCYLEGLARSLPDLGPDGVLPPFVSRSVWANGEFVDLEIHIRFADGGGAPWSLCLVTYIDVTDARRAAREQLEALKAAEIANRAKSDFLAVISHELRTPLNGVLGMAHAMASDRMSAVQRERLEVIRESGAALLATVDDLLDLSRIEAGELELANADFELRDVVESVEAAYAPQAAAKGLAFSIDVTPSLAGPCYGDAERIRQVLAALISNAVKFTPDGEVSVRLEPSPLGVRCEVRDTGVGIPADRLGRLFEPFGLADSSLTRRHGGAGLGLALSRQIVRAMGGDISVESRPGEGSLFTVDAPVASRSGQPVAKGADLGAVRVLAAEDNPVNQRVLGTLLAQVGVVPTFVENGLEAVHAWETAAWDLILMDVQMPVMDGLTATCEIRALEARRGRAATPIIAVTANAMAHQVAAYRAAGVSEVVSKPIDIQQLFAAMVHAVAFSEAA